MSSGTISVVVTVNALTMTVTWMTIQPQMCGQIGICVWTPLEVWSGMLISQALIYFIGHEWSKKEVCQHVSFICVRLIGHYRCEQCALCVSGLGSNSLFLSCRWLTGLEDKGSAFTMSFFKLTLLCYWDWLTVHVSPPSYHLFTQIIQSMSV